MPPELDIYYLAIIFFNSSYHFIHEIGISEDEFVAE
jgi:hypothetical protein